MCCDEFLQDTENKTFIAETTNGVNMEKGRRVWPVKDTTTIIHNLVADCSVVIA